MKKLILIIAISAIANFAKAQTKSIVNDSLIIKYCPAYAIYQDSLMSVQAIQDSATAAEAAQTAILINTRAAYLKVIADSSAARHAANHILLLNGGIQVVQ